MKYLLTGIMALTLLASQAQFSTDRPDEYSDYMVKEQMAVAQKMIDLTVATANSDDPNYVNSKRAAVVQQLDQAIVKISDMTPLNGSADYRDEMLALLKKSREVFVGNYVELTHLLARKSASVADLETYYLAQDKVDKELNRLEKEVKKSQEKFAKTHDMDLTTHPLQDQMAKIAKVSEYSRALFMDYLKLAKENENFTNALAAEDVAQMTKARANMMKAANPVLTRVHATKAHNGYWGFRDATLKTVNFYNDLCEKEYLELIDFIQISKKEPTTQEEVDAFNKGVERFNEIINEMNTGQGPLIDEFNNANKELMKRNLPSPGDTKG